jgi:ATP-dependent RNA helicase DDX19/DBP5
MNKIRQAQAARMLPLVMQAMLADRFQCSKLSGDMEKQARDVVVEQFRSMQTRILISTDIIARGFDVNTVTLVVNYDLPIKHETSEPDYDTYLHRIGRSGRFGKKGAAFNFVDRNFRHRNGKFDEEIMQEIELYFDRKVEEVPADDEDAFIAVLENAGLMRAED